MTRRQVEFEVVPGRFGIFPIATRLPVIPDDAPSTLREALARSRIVAAGGQCPCGVSLENAVELDDRIHPDRRTISIEHAVDCPAAADNVVPLLQAWVDGDDG